MKGILIILVLASLAALSGCLATVAVYSDVGVGAESLTAGENMLRWTGYRVRRVNWRDIEADVLERSNALYFPDGDMLVLGKTLTVKGVRSIMRFVSSGGSVIGVGAGAGLLCYGVFGRWQDSSVFFGHDESNVDVLANYEDTGQVAIVSMNKGKARVFAAFSHPEREEKNGYDILLATCALDDPDSEWGLTGCATHWILGRLARPAATPSLLGLLGLGVYLTGLVAVLVLRQTRRKGSFYPRNVAPAVAHRGRLLNGGGRSSVNDDRPPAYISRTVGSRKECDFGHI